MEEKFFSLFKNKKQLWLTIGIYIVIALFVIILIWWPKSSKIASVEQVDIEKRQAQLTQMYAIKIKSFFSGNNENKIKELISEEYLEYAGKSKEEIITELRNQGFFSKDISLTNSTLYVDGNTYIYIITMNSSSTVRKINIIEKEPYKYRIAFDGFYKYDNNEYERKKENIVFRINSIYRNLNYYEINMEIENKNSVYARFEFNNPDCVKAVLKDGTTYTLTNLVSGESYTNIEPNMTIRKNFVFQIPAQLQEGVQYILFNGVSIQFSSMNIRVEI